MSKWHFSSRTANHHQLDSGFNLRNLIIDKLSQNFSSFFRKKFFFNPIFSILFAICQRLSFIRWFRVFLQYSLKPKHFSYAGLSPLENFPPPWTTTIDHRQRKTDSEPSSKMYRFATTNTLKCLLFLYYFFFYREIKNHVLKRVVIVIEPSVTRLRAIDFEFSLTVGLYF